MKWGNLDSFFWSTIGTVEAERSKDRKKHLLRYLQKANDVCFDKTYTNVCSARDFMFTGEPVQGEVHRKNA